MAQRNLDAAKEAKNNEFYTLMEDIENEISQYDFSHFKGKTIYCNCDDPTWNNFFKFFTKWGKKMGVKEAVFTNFANANRRFGQLTLFEKDDLQVSAADDKKGTAHYWVYSPETNKTKKNKLKGNGDFRSKECIKLLVRADIVVTNPPFSLFREYVDLLVNNNKLFLIIGNKNAIAYKEIYKLIKEDKMWLGIKPLGIDLYFKILEEHKEKLLKVSKEGCAYVVKNGEILDRTAACWFTNIDITKRHKPLVLHSQDLSQFNKYDNYDAIDIPQVKLIPDNYYGAMGVPITFLDKYCSEQFELVKFRKGNNDKDLSINGKYPYFRIIIKRRYKK